MKVTEYAYRALGRYGSAALLGAALMIGASATPALAQHDHDHDHEHGQEYTNTGDSRRDAAIAGYREGFEHGRNDRSQGLGFNFEHDEAYQAAQAHEDHWGTSSELSGIFRRTYEQGYSDGYYRRAFNNRIADQFGYNTGHGYDDDRNGYGYNSRISRTDVLRLAQVNGYSEGFEHGVADRANRAGMNYQHDMEFRQATSGYRQEWGMPREYQTAFRQSYAQGYQDAYYGRTYNRNYNRAGVYQQYGRYGYDPYYGAPAYRTSPARIALNTLAQRAAQQGFEDGFVRGQYDRSIGVRRPNPQGHGAYEHALNGWNPEWGGASTFQQYYRSYFLQGYQQGYGGRARSGFVFRLF